MAVNALVTRIARAIYGEGTPSARVTRLGRSVYAEGTPAARVTRLSRTVYADTNLQPQPSNSGEIMIVT